MRVIILMFSGLLLASCSRGTPLSVLPTGKESSQPQIRGFDPLVSPHFKPVYAFKSDYNDGAIPLANLIAVSGVLYGTTQEGGQGYNGYSYGTVFKVTTAGKETVIYNFGGSASDGKSPQAALLDLNGSLYGTTREGGAGCGGFYGCGTVFVVSTSGKERILHSFNHKDGADPEAGLTAVNDTLYGTTSTGGSSRSCKGGCGVIFAISTAGKERVLHSFSGGSDGAYPVASLIVVKGILYGTTAQGGGNGCGGNGCGTVFRLSTSGAEKVLYSFKGGTEDGADPASTLLEMGDTLYGTTQDGGGNGCGGSGCGTVFAITTTGNERVLYRFKGSPSDGALAVSGLVALKGLMYGTTALGGGSCRRGGGCGTIYNITTNGKETVLHSFGKFSAGLYPEAALLLQDGNFYGTTGSGGDATSASSGGNGTVFEFSP